MIDLKKVREIANEHVRLAVGNIQESEPRITFAVRDKGLSGTEEKEHWRVNLSYTPEETQRPSLTFTKIALMKIDAETGDVVQFKEGQTWNQ